MTTQDDSNQPSKGRLRSALASVSSLFVAEVVNRATSFAVYAMVARFLGAYSFGQIALATSLFHVFNRITVMGLKTLTVREVARAPEMTGRYLLGASVTAAAASLGGYAVLQAFMSLMGYGASTQLVMRVLFVGLLPYSIGQITEAVFIARERTGFVVASSVPVNLVQTAIAFILLDRGLGVVAIAWSIAAAYLAILFLQAGFALVAFGRPRWDLDIPFMRGMVRSGAPFLGIQGTNALRSSATVIVLSALVDEGRLGLYSAAAQLLVPINLIATATAAAILPMMSRDHLEDRERFVQVGRGSMEALMALVIPAAVGLYALAGPVLSLVYGGGEFDESSNLVRILVILGLCGGYTSVMGQVLWAGDREGIALKIALSNTALILVAVWALGSRYGIEGAAWAAAVAAIVNVAQHYLPILKDAGSLRVFAGTWRSWLASIGMAAVVAWARESALAWRLVLGVATYVVLLFAVYLASDGSRFRPWAMARAHLR
jgi:O-antigen/teichoic acid export membrane protein